MSTPSAPPQLSLRDVLGIAGFRRLWISQLVSIFGDFLAIYAVYSMVSFRLHGTAREISLITVFFLLPFALVSPIAGVFVDRWDPKRTLIVSDLSRAVLILGLLLARAPWHIYAVFFVISVFSSFFMPAQSVTLPQIVPMPGLLSANALMQQAMQLARIASPAISGALVGWVGDAACYYIDSGTFLLSAFMISRIPMQPRPPHANQQVKGVMADMFSGMRFIVGHPVIGFVILSIAAGMFAMGAFGALTAVYVRDVLHQGTYLFGALGSLIGAGMLAGSFLVSRFARRVRNKAMLISVGMLTCGVNIGIIARFPYAVVAVLGCAGIGLSVSLLIIPAMTVMQGEVPAEMRGRVSSSSMSLMTLTQGVALLFAGDFASRFGIVPVYYGSAILLLVIAAFGFLRTSRTP